VKTFVPRVVTVRIGHAKPSFTALKMTDAIVPPRFLDKLNSVISHSPAVLGSFLEYSIFFEFRFRQNESIEIDPSRAALFGGRVGYDEHGPAELSYVVYVFAVRDRNEDCLNYMTDMVEDN